jgi:predicted SAM-dependent methyltransferase
MKLHLGCGYNHLDGYVNVDISNKSAADVAWDIEYGLPWDDDCVDEIITHHCLEHINDLIFVMSECYRVMKNGAIMHITVPYYKSDRAYGDPTHVRCFAEGSMKHFCNYRHSDFYGIYTNFIELDGSRRVEGHNIHYILSAKKDNAFIYPHARKLQLGCGNVEHKRNNWINIDIAPDGQPEIQRDLNKCLPFSSNTIEQIYTAHTLEHIENLVGVMNESFRVLIPGGKMDVVVPSYDGVGAWGSPTHVRCFSALTMREFCGYGAGEQPMYNIKCKFEQLLHETGPKCADGSNEHWILQKP